MSKKNSESLAERVNRAKDNTRSILDSYYMPRGKQFTLCDMPVASVIFNFFMTETSTDDKRQKNEERIKNALRETHEQFIYPGFTGSEHYKAATTSLFSAIFEWKLYQNK